MGTRWANWNMAEELIPREGLAEINPFRSWDVIRAIHDRLKLLERGPLHTGGFPQAPMAPALWNDREGRIRRFADWRLTWAAGTAFEYHPASGHWVLAELIQRATGRDFREVVRDSRNWSGKVG